MKCDNCGENTAFIEYRTREVKVIGKGESVIVQDVPMIVCKSCSEVLITPETKRRLDEIKRHPEEAEQKLVANY